MSGHTLARRIVISAIVLMALTIASAAAAAPQSSAWVVLDSGRQGEYLWSVKARRSSGASGAGALSGARPPCLMIGTMWQRSPFSFGRTRYRQCADAPGRLAATEPPLVASGIVLVDATQPKMTAVGMIFAPQVRRLRVTFADGTTETIPADRPTPDQSRRGGLAGLRYAAFSVRGAWCPERLVSQSASGRTLWDGGIETQAC
jgi:hypothetical protein